MNRKNLIQASHLNALADLMEKRSDIFFKERPFLEDRNKPLIILDLSHERKAIDDQIKVLVGLIDLDIRKEYEK